MNDIDGVVFVNGPKSPTTEPRCQSDQIDPLVRYYFNAEMSCSGLEADMHIEDLGYAIGKHVCLGFPRIRKSTEISL